MQLVEGLKNLPNPLAPSVVAVGTFDGLHVGHQAIIVKAVTEAKVAGLQSVVFTFDRHPFELLAPDRAPAAITTHAQRCEMVEQLGADLMIVAEFDTWLAGLEPEQFVNEILKGWLSAEAIVVGTGFCFGKARAGDTRLLELLQRQLGYTLHSMNPVLVDGSPASSTRVRDLILSGETLLAERVLGHPYLLEGEVVEGQKLGRELGFPTANMRPSPRQIVPPDGIYAVEVTLQNEKRYGGACSIGNRPTIEGAGRAIETYILDFTKDIYGQQHRIRFLTRLRGEVKFDSLEELKHQMKLDVLQAREVYTGQ